MVTVSRLDPDERPDDFEDRVQGAFLGAAVGDALGWQGEDRGGRVGGWRGLEPAFELTSWTRSEGGKFKPHQELIDQGSYSDDTQLLLAVARARLAGGEWWRHLTEFELPLWTFYERGGGGATKRATDSWLRGVPPWQDKKADGYWRAGGNGVAMRIAPHALRPDASRFEDVARAVMDDGLTTHGHPRALVGAVMHAFSIWSSATSNAVIGYGEMIERLLSAPDWKLLVEPDAVPDWLDLASRFYGRDYDLEWRAAVAEVERMLAASLDGIARGALSVDRPVLEELGAFGKSNGAGTVSAASAAFLASRYATHPSGGVVAAAFARGADTDTLASMTGSILGAIHGADWLSGIARTLEDADYIRSLARRTASPTLQPARAIQGVQSRAKFWRSFAEPPEGSTIQLADGVEGVVERVVVHKSSRPTLLARSWVVRTSYGQTLRFKRFKTVAPPADPRLQESSSTRTANGHESMQRGGVTLKVSGFKDSTFFYRDILGLQPTREIPGRTVFAKFVAIEPAEDVAIAAQQLDIPEFRVQATLNASLVITVILRLAEVEKARDQCESHGRPTLRISARGELLAFRVFDPDGNVVEIRAFEPDAA